MSVRVGRVITGRVRIEQRADYPHVYDADTGEEISRRIRIEYQGRLRCARPGQRVRFEAFIHDERGPILCGDRLLTEVWRAEVTA